MCCGWDSRGSCDCCGGRVCGVDGTLVVSGNVVVVVSIAVKALVFSGLYEC